MRVETGPMRFGDDWPGLFIRGDESLHFGLLLKELLERLESDDQVDYFAVRVLEGLANRLSSVENQACKDTATALKAFEECKEKK